jgi:hypothetical protein
LGPDSQVNTLPDFLGQIGAEPIQDDFSSVASLRPDNHLGLAVMLQSPESKKIAETAQAMVRDFGGNAVIDAHEAAAAANEARIKRVKPSSLQSSARSTNFTGDSLSGAAWALLNGANWFL